VRLTQLQQKQDRAFGTDGPLITTPAAAERFLARVGIALRYGATPNLPIASLQRVFAGDEPDKAAAARGIALTNHLLERSAGIEVHVIAGRVAVVHRDLMPALYTLVRRGRAMDDLTGLSLNAQTALKLLQQRTQATAGDVRDRLGLAANPRKDPAYEALGELTRVLLVDRGPFEIPEKGIPYLSIDGYPYHLFHRAHADLVAASRRHSPETAAEAFLEAYLAAAAFGRARKLATLFKVFLSAAEIHGALQRLVERRRVSIEKLGSQEYAVIAKA
jgi:hypothetical protein